MLVKQKEMPTFRSQRQRSLCLLLDRPPLLEKAQIFFFSCSTMHRFPNVMHSISDRTRQNHTSTISRSSSRCLVKQFAMIYCFCMPLLDVTRCPGYSELVRSWGSNESIKKEKAMKDCSKAFSRPKQSQDVVETNGCKAMVACSMQIKRTPWHLSDIICSARKLRELKCSSRQNVSHRPPRPVNFIPCGLTTRLWSGWDVVMKWIHLSRDGRYNNNNNNNNTEKNLFQ